MAKDYSIGYKFKGDSAGFQRAVGNMNKSINGFKNTMSLAAKTFLALFSIRAIANFTKQSIVAYDQQAKAEQSLLIALKGRSDIQKSLIQQATDLQKKTLFGDEETIMAASRMAMVIGANESAIKRLMPLVQDLASAKFEGNLVTASDMVAKSVGSSTNALSRYGIEIKGAVGSTDRLESAIAGLNRQVGGQAEAAALVGLGPLKQLKNAWGDLTEVIGKSIVESEGFKKSITGLARAVQDISERGLLRHFFEKPEITAARAKESAKWDLKPMLPDVSVVEVIKEVDNTISDLVKKIYDGAESSKQMAAAWKIVHAEIAATAGATDLKGISTANLAFPTLGTTPATPGLQKSYIEQLPEIDQMNKVLTDQANIVYGLTDAFQSMFSNIDRGFKGMAEALINSIKMIAAELAAKAAVFGILKLLFPEMFATGRLLEGVSFGKFLTGSFASGTNYAPGGLSLVGERGPEVVNLPRGSKVTPMGGTFEFKFKDVKLKGTDLYFAVVRTAEMMERNT